MRLVSTRFSTAERDTVSAWSSNHSSLWAGPGTGVGERESRRGAAPGPGALGGPVGSGRSDWDAPIGGGGTRPAGAPAGTRPLAGWPHAPPVITLELEGSSSS